jgi:hypothetical protein
MSVLRRQASHLLLIRTNLGHGTVLTAASARQGCSATDYLFVVRTLYGPVEEIIFLLREGNEVHLQPEPQA